MERAAEDREFFTATAEVTKFTLGYLVDHLDFPSQQKLVRAAVELFGEEERFFFFTLLKFESYGSKSANHWMVLPQDDESVGRKQQANDGRPLKQRKNESGLCEGSWGPIATSGAQEACEDAECGLGCCECEKCGKRRP